MLNLHPIISATKTYYKILYLGLEWIYSTQIINLSLITCKYAYRMHMLINSLCFRSKIVISKNMADNLFIKHDEK